MKDFPFSNCERRFILQCLSEGKRIDNRGVYDYRSLRITFGKEQGTCYVALGKTLIWVKVSCEISKPKEVRPQEGLLYINVELTTLAAPHFKHGRNTDFLVEINRLFERNFIESRCLDLESLCIVAGEKVWKVTVDMNVLNHDGNIVDCASIAIATALSHFRIPVVSVHDGETIIHSPTDRDPQPLHILHIPLFVTFAFFEQGRYLLVDPTDAEEKAMEGTTIIAMNKYREICTLHLSGDMLLDRDQVHRCANVASVKVLQFIELISEALENDKKARESGQPFGFAERRFVEATVGPRKPRQEKMDYNKADANGEGVNGQEEEDNQSYMDHYAADEATAKAPADSIGEGGKNSWELDDNALLVDSFLKQMKEESVQRKSTDQGATGGFSQNGESEESEEEEKLVLNLSASSAQKCISKAAVASKSRNRKKWKKK